jgi:hypothetical protein
VKELGQRLVGLVVEGVVDRGLGNREVVSCMYDNEYAYQCLHSPVKPVVVAGSSLTLHTHTV